MIQITSEKNKQECMTCQICLVTSKKCERKIPVFCKLASISSCVCRWLYCITQSEFCGFGDHSYSTKLSTCQKGAFKILATASSPVSLVFLNLNLKSLWLESSCSSPVSSEGVNITSLTGTRTEWNKVVCGFASCDWQFLVNSKGINSAKRFFVFGRICKVCHVGSMRFSKIKNSAFPYSKGLCAQPDDTH